MDSVVLKTVGDILTDNTLTLIIPDYQRGYRWRGGNCPETSQIIQLLNDILEYSENKRNKYRISTATTGNEDIFQFYCLQPIVVTKNRERENDPGCKYSLVDGQQRLTTLWLINRYLEIRQNEEILKMAESIGPDKVKEIFDQRIKKTCCKLQYETRQDSADFLDQIHQEGIEYSTIDQYYLLEAYRTIGNWFSLRSNNEIDAIQTVLKIKMDECQRDTKLSLRVIWYELDTDPLGNDDASQIALFNRINRGKIPLTSAELIKAFLFGEFDKLSLPANYHSEKPGTEAKLEKQYRASERSRFEKEWEEFENLLADNLFWGFLCDKEYDTRIEYLFELLIRKDWKKDWEEEILEQEKIGQEQNKTNPQRTFYLFKKIYDGVYETADVARNEIFNYFQKLRKYDKTHELYHLIGYLVHIKVPFYKIVEELDKKSTEDACVDYLKKRIRQAIFDQSQNWKERIGKLVYEPVESKRPADQGEINPQLIRWILLLFNIDTIIRNGKQDLSSEQDKKKKTPGNEQYWFPFKNYRDINWDIEHICSQATDRHLEEQDEKRQKIWLLTLLEYYCGVELMNKWFNKENIDPELERIWNEITDKIKKDNISETSEKDWSRKGIEQRRIILLKNIVAHLLQKKDAVADFKQILDDANTLEREGKEPPEAAQDLSNLTLLDDATNRSYKDAPFPVKRARILKNEKDGIFVLPCTKNVFLKAYSKTLDDMLYWDPHSDGKYYKESIISQLTEFFPADTKKEENNA